MYALFFILPFLIAYTIVVVYVERKLSAFIQDRLGPMEVGPKGIIQTLADVIKLIQKEQIVPSAADKWVFLGAPVLIFVSIFAGFAVMPFAPGLMGSATGVGVFYLLAIISLDVVGMLLAGWASNNKYSVLGAMRAVAQVISYEVPVTLLVLAVIMICQTLDLNEINKQQGILINHDVVNEKYLQANYFLGVKAWNMDVTEVGGITTWNIFRYPLLLIGLPIFFIATLAESNRAPFDLPEAESELIAGFQTEYSGFRWSIIMLGEYAMMLLVAMLGVTLFLGGWNTPLPNIGGARLADWTTGTYGEWSGIAWGIFWLLLKSLTWVSLQIWVRWAYPRLRVDQLLYLCWKVLTPAALIIVLGAGVWRMLMI